MIDLLRLRAKQGKQYIDDLTSTSLSESFRGYPVLNEEHCSACGDCVAVCPTGAITTKPLSLDMGKCLFCGECALACGRSAIHFTNEHRLAATHRESLVVTAASSPAEHAERAVTPRPDLGKLFKRSLKIRSVSAGGCNACELELAATTNVNFDVGRFGIDIVASPRHADAVVVTGPITENMADALEQTYQAVPQPKILILMGACAISGGLFARSSALERAFLERHRVDLYLPGSPPHPLTLIDALLRLLGRRFMRDMHPGDRSREAPRP